MHSILIVDDNPENLHLLVQIMEGQDYHVHPAISATVALDFLVSDQRPPDIILLDINMPEMNGYELCRRIKENKKCSHIPVIFISVANQIADKATAFAHGGVDYIVKPFVEDEILMRLKAHLNISDKLNQEIALRKHVERSLENLSSDSARSNDQPESGPVAEQGSNGTEFSPRELQILKLVNSGLGNGAIASVLFLAEVTVKWHLKNIYLKLDVKNRSQAIIEARKRHFV